MSSKQAMTGIPSYRRHRASGQVVVTLNGVDHYRTGCALIAGGALSQLGLTLQPSKGNARAAASGGYSQWTAYLGNKAANILIALGLERLERILESGNDADQHLFPPERFHEIRRRSSAELRRRSPGSNRARILPPGVPAPRCSPSGRPGSR